MVDGHPKRLPADVIAVYGGKAQPANLGGIPCQGFARLHETTNPTGFNTTKRTFTASPSGFRTLPSQTEVQRAVPVAPSRNDTVERGQAPDESQTGAVAVLTERRHSRVTLPDVASVDQQPAGDLNAGKHTSTVITQDNNVGEPGSPSGTTDVYTASALHTVASHRGKKLQPRRSRNQHGPARRTDEPRPDSSGAGRIPPTEPPPTGQPAPDGDGEGRNPRVDINTFAASLELMAASAHSERWPLDPRMYHGVAQMVRRPPAPDRFKQFISEEAPPEALDTLIDGYTTLMKDTGFSRADSVITAGMIASLDVSIRVKEVKCRTVGNDQLSPVTEAVGASIAERFAHRVAFQHYDALSQNLHPLHTINETANALLREDRYAANLAPDIQYYAAEVQNGFNLAQHLESLATAEEGISYEQLKDANDKLFEKTRLLQRYGVKSAIAPSILGGRVHEWLVLDYDTAQAAEKINNEDYGTNFGPMRYAGRHIALFVGTPGRFSSSRAEYKTQKGSRIGAKLTSLDLSSLLEDGSDPSTVIKLMQDGHLATNFGRPIPEILEEAGAGMREYEILRGEILALFADSVTPVTVSRIVEQEMAEHATATQGDSERKPSLYPLVLARERVIDTLGEDIIEELEQETRQPEQETQQAGEREKKHMIEHPVVWHIRTINPRYRASPQARELAWTKQGIILAEYGETYVDATTRGDLPADSVKGHKVVQRQPSDARKDDE